MEVIGMGSVVQRDKSKTRARCRKWELSVKVDDGGRKRRRTRAFSGTYTQAQAALREFVDELGETRATSDVTFREYADEWHGKRERSGALARRTMKSEGIKLRNAYLHIDKPLGKVCRDDIERMYAALMGGETLSGRPWAPKTVDHLHRILGHLFRDAVADGVIPSVPTDGVLLPKGRPRRIVALSNAEMDSLLASLDYSDGPSRAVALCCACGLRRSEACAVEWRDLAEGSIRVETSLEDDGDEKDTKTGKVRTVPVPPSVYEMLEANRATGSICGLARPNSLTKWWQNHRADYGLDCTLHDLRHGYATRLARAGVHPKLMMSLGGWSSISVCMEIYTHVSNEMQREAVLSAFGGKNGDSVRVSCGFDLGT